MSRKSLALLTALAVGGIAGAAFPLLRQSVPNGIPNISGSWVGKVSFKGYDLAEPSSGDSGTCPISMSVTQTGADITVQLVADCPSGEQSSAFLLYGKVGNSHFWAQGSDTSAEGTGDGLILSGKISGSSSKLKAKGMGILIHDSGSECSEVKFGASRLP